MIKWTILLIIIAIIIGFGCKWFYEWLNKGYFAKGTEIKDVSSVSDKLPLDVRDRKFNNKKDLGKIPYNNKNKKDELNVKSIKPALKNVKKGKQL